MSVSIKLKNKIVKQRPGAVFCANDFLDLGSKGNIDVILHRLSKSGQIRKLGFGLYDKPRNSKLLGDLAPDLVDVIDAYSRRTGYVIVMDPLSAANTMSLTTQVPAHVKFLTDGKSHDMTICGIHIKLVHTSPKKMAGAGTQVGVIIQALQYFGRKVIPGDAIRIIASQLTQKDVQNLKSLRDKTLRYLTPQIDRIIESATAS